MKYTEFAEQYKACGEYKWTAESAEISTAYNVYCMAQLNRYNFCLIGKLNDIGSVVAPVADSGGEWAAEHTDLAGNFFYTSKEKKGNLLKIEKWTVGINDAWILGGVESGSKFYFIKDGGVKRFEDIYIETGNSTHPVSVTAREIIGLRCFGYEPVLENDMLVFLPGNADTEVTLRAYNNAVNNFIKDNTRKDSLETTKESILQYFRSYKLFRDNAGK